MTVGWGYIKYYNQKMNSRGRKSSFKYDKWRKIKNFSKNPIDKIKTVK